MKLCSCRCVCWWWQFQSNVHHRAERCCGVRAARGECVWGGGVQGVCLPVSKCVNANVMALRVISRF
jgi:hypothetical protein